MEDEDHRGAELPHRVRGAARPDVRPSGHSSLPTLSEELRQRIREAVQAERAEASTQGQERKTGQERETDVPRRASRPKGATGKAASPAGHGGGNGTNGKAKRAVAAGADVTAEPKGATAAVPAGTGLSAENEVTEWPGFGLSEPAQSRPAARPQPPAGSQSSARPQPTPKPAATSGKAGVKPPAAAPEPRRPSPPGPLVPQKRRRRRRAGLAALVVGFVLVGSLAVVAVKYFTRPPAASSAALRQEAAVRDQAAIWVLQQVSPTVAVSCDPAMCAALRARGFPSGKLVVLGPSSPEPPPSALVVETPAVYDMFGSSLATAGAPAVLASFGSGPTGITVRVVASHGFAAYQASLSADLAARKTSGAALLNDSQITVSDTAKSQLIAGQVDSRLMLALASLAGHQPIDIVQFTDPGPGAGPGIPLRFADLAVNVPAAHTTSTAYTQAVRADLNSADPQVRPARTVATVVQGQAVLEVEFTAPSPLGMFSAQGSS